MTEKRNIVVDEDVLIFPEGPFAGLPYKLNETPSVKETEDGGLAIEVDYSIMAKISDADAKRFEKTLINFITKKMLEFAEGLSDDA